MEDRHAVCGALVRSVAIECVVEDGTDRADLDGAGGGSFEAIDAERSGEAQNAEAGSESLLRMGPPLQDEIAQGGGCRPHAGGVLADAVDGPVGVAAMTGRHVVRNGGVFVVAARSQMYGDPL